MHMYILYQICAFVYTTSLDIYIQIMWINMNPSLMSFWQI